MVNLYYLFRTFIHFWIFHHCLAQTSLSKPFWGFFHPRYVDHCIVHDLESDTRYYIICGKWLMIGSEGVGLDNTFNLASDKELHQFGLLFTSRTIRDLRDGHLWLSVLMRPKHSHFTCVQRVSCCLSLLMCMMMTSIMFYGVPTDPADQVMDFGTFRITLKEIIIGIESSVIAFPVNLLIVLLFRHVRPRDKTRTQSIKEKYIVDEFGELSQSPSSIESNLSVDLESGANIGSGVKKDAPLGCKSASHVSIENEEKQTAKKSSISSKETSTECEEGLFTSSVDHTPRQSGASTNTSSSLSSCTSLDSDLPTLGKLEPRSLSDVMADWDYEQTPTLARQSQSDKLHDGRPGTEEKDNSQRELSRDESRGSSLLHNTLLNTNVVDMMTEMMTTIRDRFPDLEDQQQALTRVHRFIMTAADRVKSPVSSCDSSSTRSSISQDKKKCSKKVLFTYILSVESQKGVITIQ